VINKKHALGIAILAIIILLFLIDLFSIEHPSLSEENSERNYIQRHLENVLLHDAPDGNYLHVSGSDDRLVIAISVTTDFVSISDFGEYITNVEAQVFEVVERRDVEIFKYDIYLMEEVDRPFAIWFWDSRFHPDRHGTLFFLSPSSSAPYSNIPTAEVEEIINASLE